MRDSSLCRRRLAWSVRAGLVASLVMAVAVGAGLSCVASPGSQPSKPPRKACKVDRDCGEGFDCVREVCLRVCNKDPDCDSGQYCYRHRCFNRPAANPALSSDGAPVVPHGVLEELRAIRRQLELIHEDNQKLLEKLGK